MNLELRRVQSECGASAAPGGPEDLDRASNGSAAHECDTSTAEPRAIGVEIRELESGERDSLREQGLLKRLSPDWRAREDSNFRPPVP
jgi:hypothetical protein